MSIPTPTPPWRHTAFSVVALAVCCTVLAGGLAWLGWSYHQRSHRVVALQGQVTDLKAGQAALEGALGSAVTALRKADVPVPPVVEHQVELQPIVAPSSPPSTTRPSPSTTTSTTTPPASTTTSTTVPQGPCPTLPVIGVCA